MSIKLQKKSPNLTMSDYLHPEIWLKILLKLPVKSVIRFIAVCKQWRSTITSPAFISDHLSLARQNSLHFDSLHRLSQTLHRLPPSRDYDTLSAVGSSLDGLILLSGDFYTGRHPCYRSTLILWNPSIRKYVTLPAPSFTFPENVDPLTFRGLGVNHATGDYEVVMIVYPPHSELSLVEVYSLRDRSWRTVISDNPSSMKIYSDQTQCFIHGAVHWIGCKRDPHENGILLFDTEKEVFGMMALPEYKDVDGWFSWEFYISVVGGLLSVCIDRINWANNYRPDYTNVWVKTDYYTDSWTKIATLDEKKLRIGASLDMRRAFGESTDFQVLPQSNFLVDKFRDNFVFSYTDSLLLLEEDKAVLEV